MWNTLEAKYRQAHRMWENAAYAKIAEKDALISDLTVKLRKLEDDFAYNYKLLNIREQENLRCRSEMTELIRRLNNSAKEVRDLQTLLKNNTKTVSKLEFIHDKDKQTLQKLSLIIRNIKNDLQSQQTMTDFQLKTIQDKDEKIQNLTKELQELHEQNIKLEQENDCLKTNVNLSSTEYKQIELTLKKNLGIAEEKIRNLTNEKLLLESENVKLIETNAKLEQKYLYETNINNEITRQNESLRKLNEVNDDLNEQILSLKEQIKEMASQNNVMKSSYNYLKQITCTLIENRNEILHIVKKLKDSNFHTNNRERDEEFERLTKQNFILKDVIKKLKYERDEHNIQTALSLSSTPPAEKSTPSQGDMHNLSRQQFVAHFWQTHEHRLNKIREENMKRNNKLNI